jgi:hypothetical protein
MLSDSADLQEQKRRIVTKVALVIKDQRFDCEPCIVGMDISFCLEFS